MASWRIRSPRRRDPLTWRSPPARVQGDGAPPRSCRCCVPSSTTKSCSASPPTWPTTSNGPSWSGPSWRHSASTGHHPAPHAPSRSPRTSPCAGRQLGGRRLPGMIATRLWLAESGQFTSATRQATRQLLGRRAQQGPVSVVYVARGNQTARPMLRCHLNGRFCGIRRHAHAVGFVRENRSRMLARMSAMRSPTP